MGLGSPQRARIFEESPARFDIGSNVASILSTRSTRGPANLSKPFQDGAFQGPESGPFKSQCQQLLDIRSVDCLAPTAPPNLGKTTLFRLLMGILKATEGRLVLIDGRDAFEDRVEVKRLIGFLPDEPVFYSYLSGREHLQLSAAMHGLDVDETMHRIEPLIARLRLASTFTITTRKTIPGA
jgi:ABC-type glutathione transport system ATPase component